MRLRPVDSPARRRRPTNHCTIFYLVFSTGRRCAETVACTCASGLTLQLDESGLAKWVLRLGASGHDDPQTDARAFAAVVDADNHAILALPFLGELTLGPNRKLTSRNYNGYVLKVRGRLWRVGRSSGTRKDLVVANHLNSINDTFTPSVVC